MKNQKEKTEKTTVVINETPITNTVRVQKKDRKRIQTKLNINESVQGESIELMLERIREGEGEETISDRDLVYNDNESSIVNPITNIRTDKFEAMLEEKIGQQEHERKKIQRTKDAEEQEEENKKLTETESQKDTGTQE